MTQLLQEDISPMGYHLRDFAMLSIFWWSSLCISLFIHKAFTQILKYSMAEIIIASHMKRYSLPVNESIWVGTGFNYANLFANGHFLDSCRQSNTIDYELEWVNVLERQ